MSKKQDIIDATIYLVAREGVGGASTANIAKQANVATGTLFHHFPKKHHLLEETYLAIQDRKMASAYAGECLSDNISFEEKTRYFVEHVTTYWISHRDEFEFTRQFFHSPWYTEEVGSRALERHSAGVSMLADAMKAKDIRSMDMNFLMPAIHTITLFIAERVLSTKNKKERDIYLEEGYQLLWNMLKPV